MQANRHILAVFYDPKLVPLRLAGMDDARFHLTTAGSMDETLALLGSSRFALVILGDDIPFADRRILVQHIRRTPQTALIQFFGDTVVAGCEASARVDLMDGPGALNKAIAEAFRKRDRRALRFYRGIRGPRQ